MGTLLSADRLLFLSIVIGECFYIDRNGASAPGYSSAQAMKALEEVFEQTMPREMGYDYKDISFQEKKAQQGVPPAVVFGFSLLFVFLILAALYESWSLPFSVLLSTPVPN